VPSTTASIATRGWSGLARRLSPSRADAEDAVQEIFLELWKSAARFDAGVASEPTFVSMIARRRLIDRSRRQQRHPGTAPLADAEQVADPDASDKPDVADDADRALQAMNSLDADRRRILELSIYEGRTHVEIAQQLSMPIGTVKSHARRGLHRLREMLDSS